MLIVFRFLLKNIWEKKFRTFLIIFSVAMSAALFFASTAIGDNVVKMFMSQAKQRFGSSDIIIHQNERSPSSFIYTDGAKNLSDRFEYIIGSIQFSSLLRYNRNEKLTIKIEGITLEDLQTMNPIMLSEGTTSKPFTGDMIIVSKKTAEKYNLKYGQTLDLEINRVKYRFTLYGIAQPTGYFLENGQETFAVIPKRTAASIFNAAGKSNMIYLKLKNRTELSQAIVDLSKIYKRYTVEEPISEEELRQETGSISTGFMLMTFVVLFMGIFIIYTSFKVITMERLPVIGTFRSIGATRKTTDFVLLSESALYGIIGGVLGCALGVGILYTITVMITPPWMQDYKVRIDFNIMQLVFAMILAMFLSFISSIIPIIKVSRIPVKEIVLNKIEKNNKPKIYKLFLGMAFLIVSVAIPPFIPKNEALIIDTICMLLSISAIVILVPYATNVFVRIFERIYILTFGNEGTLAAKNLRENKSIINNISLLAIAISSLLMITTVSDSVMSEVTNFFANNSRYDIIFFSSELGREYQSQMLTVDGIKSVYGNYESGEIKIAGKPDSISNVQGIHTNNFLEYITLDIEGDSKSLFAKLNTGRYIMITNMLKEQFNVKKGDTITLKMKQGNRDYTIIGFYNTLLDGGSHALIADKYFESDMGIHFYSNFLIKTSKNPDQVVKALEIKFARMQPYMITINELAEENKEMNAKIFNTMKGFSIMALLIGTFGIFNNFIISFIERKRYLAIFRSIGMRKKQIIKMMFIESLTGGIIGGIIGVLAGIIILTIIPCIMKAINEPISIFYTTETILTGFILGVVITLVASISPALSSSKLNIIESIKFE